MATEVLIDDPPTDAVLVDAKTRDYYKFAGKAGERLIIAGLAPSLTTNSDPTIVDATLVLIGPDMDVANPLTYQSDAWPAFGQDAIMLVQLPKDGEYYVAIQDCNALFKSGCPNDPAGIVDLEYNLLIAHMDKLVTPEANASMQGGTIANPVVLKYTVAQGAPAGQYGEVFLGGAFQSAAAKTQVFSFTPPLDTATAAGARSRAEFYIQPIGGFQGGDLSLANVKVWATDMTGNVVLSSADQNKYPTNSMTYSPMQFSVPVTLGQQYFLFVQNTNAAAAPLTDFYFIAHYLNPLIDAGEKELPAVKGDNDTSATAEDMLPQGSAKHFFTVDGNLSSAGATGDTDWFTFIVPAGVTQYQVACDAARTGSGLGGFKVEILGKDGVTSLATATETADADLVTMVANVVPADTSMFLKLTAATQDAVVTGTFYRCYAFFQ